LHVNIKQKHGFISEKVIRMGEIDKRFRNRIVFLILLLFTNEFIFTKLIFQNDIEKALLFVIFQYAIRVGLIVLILFLSLFYYRKKMGESNRI
jgi:hypothetical protein